MRFVQTTALASAVVVSAALLGAGIAEAVGPEAMFYACEKNGNVQALTISYNEQPTCRLGARVVSWNQTGPVGPQGPAGPEGSGGQGDADVATWNAEFEADGSETAIVNSSDGIDPLTLVTPVRMKMTGDFSSCSQVEVMVWADENWLVNGVRRGGEDWTYSMMMFPLGDAGVENLRIEADCWAPDGNTQLPVPDFEAAFTFEMEHQSDTPTVAFD